MLSTKVSVTKKDVMKMFRDNLQLHIKTGALTPAIGNELYEAFVAEEELYDSVVELIANSDNSYRDQFCGFECVYDNKDFSDYKEACGYDEEEPEAFVVTVVAVYDTFSIMTLNRHENDDTISVSTGELLCTEDTWHMDVVFKFHKIV